MNDKQYRALLRERALIAKEEFQRFMFGVEVPTRLPDRENVLANRLLAHYDKE